MTLLFFRNECTLVASHIGTNASIEVLHRPRSIASIIHRLFQQKAKLRSILEGNLHTQSSRKALTNNLYRPSCILTCLTPPFTFPKTLSLYKAFPVVSLHERPAIGWIGQKCLYNFCPVFTGQKSLVSIRMGLNHHA